MPLLAASNPDLQAAAEAMVAAALGVTTLERGSVSESGSIGAGGLISLNRPAVSIQSLTVAGAPAIGILSNLWTLDVSGAVNPYLTNHAYMGNVYAPLPYAVTYTAGWTAEDVPPGIAQAIRLTAQSLEAAASRVGLKSESMGPASYTYDTSTPMPYTVGALLLPYRRIIY